MLDWISNSGDVTEAVKLALAPVFLLTGIAGVLNVMTGRLARIIDRGRWLEENYRAGKADISADIKAELENLERRRNISSLAIFMCVLSALLVCTVVSLIFLEALLLLKLKWLVGSLFLASTMALTVGLGFFMREVRLATSTVSILSPHFQDSIQK